jgi:PAS domain S-box-containing protein
MSTHSYSIIILSIALVVLSGWVLLSYFKNKKQQTDEFIHPSGRQRTDAHETISIISEMQTLLLKTDDVIEIYRVVAEKIRELVGNGIVISSILDESIQGMRAVAYYGLNVSIARVIQILGVNPTKTVYYLKDMTETELTSFRTPGLKQLEGGVYALLTRTVPKKLCNIIEKMLDIDSVYTISFIWQKQHLGGTTILTRGDLSSKKDAIEMIMNQAAITINRIRTEVELSKREEKYRLIAENMADIITVMDLDLNFTYVSPSIIKLLGFTVEEALKYRIDQIMTRESFQRLSNAFAEELRLEEKGTADPDRVRIMELEEYKKDGSIIWVENTASFIRDNDQKPVGILVVSRDITKRKKTEEELSQIFTMSLDMICIADINTSTFLKVNPAFKETLGFSEVELLEKTFLEFIHPDDVESTISIVENELQSGKKVINFENRYRCKDGSYKWLSWVSHPQPQKGITYAVARDITQAKQIEKELADSEKRYKSLFSSTNDGICLHEIVYKDNTPIDYKILDVNPKYEQIIGISRSDATGSLASNLYKTNRAPYLDLYAHVADTGAPTSLEIYFQPMDKNFHISVFSPIKHQFATVFQDITEQKKFEKTIIEQKQIAERYLNLAGVMFIGLDYEGNVNITNKKACDILECSEKDIIGQNWFDNFIPQKIRNNVYSVFKQLIDGNVEPVEYYENLVVAKSGKEKLIAWHNTYVKDEYGKIIGILASGEDITEKRELEKQLIQAQKMEAIGTLAGGIAHDFNNILSSIIGFTELALDDVEKGTLLEENLQEVFIAGNRAKDLIGQILTISRHEAIKFKLILINSVVKEAVKMLRATIPTSINIQGNICDKQLLVEANPTQIHQVIINLATNAKHAMSETGGVLVVDVEPVSFDESTENINLTPGDYARITVSDTGAGINKEHLEKIFEPYFTTKAVGEGSGLGLSVVHGIVKAHQGDIAVYSELGKGTKFHVYLPLSEQQSIELPDTTSEPLPKGTERILLVDDEPSIVKMQQQSLERLGYKVTIKTSSVDALETFCATPEKYDLVITDMTMPDMSGDKFADEIKKIRHDVPVILCTGFSEKIKIRTGSDLQINEFILKPIDQKKLAKIIRKLLDNAES